MSSPGDSSRSLSGQRIVVTRARAQSKELVDALELRGASVIVLPTIEVAKIEDTSELDRALGAIDRHAAVIIGSKNAAEVLFDRADALGVTINVPVACVGQKTLAYVSKRTGARTLAPREHRAEALLELLVAEL